MTEDENKNMTETLVATLLAIVLAFVAGAIVGYATGIASSMSDMRISIEDEGMVIAELYGNEWVHFAE